MNTCNDGVDRSGAVKRLSIIVPAYNEEHNLRPFYERLSAALTTVREWDAEIIFIDDGSRDSSFEKLLIFHHTDPRVKVLRMSRNFGPWSAVLAGFHAASGDAVVWMASDLQDPPELIPQLVRRLDEGADVVWAVRASRHDPWLRRMMAAVFYRMLRRIALPTYPTSGTDICLMRRRVAVLFRSLKERNRFTQGLIMSLGFTQVTVPYLREKRGEGRSKLNLSRLTKIGIDMIISCSPFPLRIVFNFGVLIAVGAVVFGAVTFAQGLGVDTITGAWRWLLVAASVLSALPLIAVGILGEYVWRVLDEVRERPQYVIRDQIGFSDAVALTDRNGGTKEDVSVHP
jgi:polyisoprenyl-phosphate glycosyltransferase